MMAGDVPDTAQCLLGAELTLWEVLGSQEVVELGFKGNSNSSGRALPTPPALQVQKEMGGEERGWSSLLHSI